MLMGRPQGRTEAPAHTYILVMVKGRRGGQRPQHTHTHTVVMLMGQRAGQGRGPSTKTFLEHRCPIFT